MRVCISGETHPLNGAYMKIPEIVSAVKSLNFQNRFYSIITNGLIKSSI